MLPSNKRVRRVLGLPLRGWLGLRVEGASHVPATGPVLLASTHTSHADNLALGVAFDRSVHFLGTASLLETPVIGGMLTDLGMVPVQRGGDVDEALQIIADLLAAGEAVVIYPEGSRSRDGKVYRPRSGIARLAAASNVPVVPIGVVGTRDLWPVGQRPRPRRGHVRVRVGAPMRAPADNNADRRRFQQALHRQLVMLSGAPAAETFAPASDQRAAA